MKLAVSRTGLTEHEFAQDCSLSDPPSTKSKSQSHPSEITANENNESPETAMTFVSGTYLLCSCSPPDPNSKSPTSPGPYPLTPESKSPAPSSVNSCSVSSLGSGFSFIRQLSGMLMDTEQDIALAEHGFQRISKLCDTMQGELWKGKTLQIPVQSNMNINDTESNSLSLHNHGTITSVTSRTSRYSTTLGTDLSNKSSNKSIKGIPSFHDSSTNDANSKMVVIKSVDRSVRRQHEVAASSEDGVSFIVDEDLYKESLILKYLTMDNDLFGDGQYGHRGIPKYIDYFTTTDTVYLVEEYIDGIGMTQFVESAYRFIAESKLRMKEYKKTMKNVLWQLINVIQTLHSVYHCCHLDLCLDNVLLQNATFIHNDDGTVSISHEIRVKIVDFGVAEVFDGHTFECTKDGLTITNSTYQSPQVLAGSIEPYDPRAADMWQIGILFYFGLVGRHLYVAPDVIRAEMEQKGPYYALYRGELKAFCAAEGTLKVFKSQAFDLLNALLSFNEKDRITAGGAIKHKWFDYYRRQYARQIRKRHSLNHFKLSRLKRTKRELFKKMKSQQLY